MLTANHRLAIYGSLAPGEAHHDELEGLTGTWRTGTVRGWYSADGWGLTEGYPGLRLDPTGDEIQVLVFESAGLPDHWPRLDAFEGDAYARVVTGVDSALGVVEASIYVVKE